ncbi:uncharacterized protein LOC110110168 [Dendrobium catenatum]|uniref:Remorin C-terminal domain-containing protein n=1 Tax=Dendrobium catenatum TaxID=906689 RepID=A0A2I0W878_9ASPA|nr:uncharacterized protein LOC110110168 [Dendrobium catenatum]XP_028553875.1 uncharacterized protein LOC110110168 [Dendrobium catenatum]XP_028553877.1 uncharacterized protein LOC110110168 [Dendrobium catenatum]PKU71869.1 Uncharacterized protein MA16_Dca016322 [Dendrobium catenatum]
MRSVAMDKKACYKHSSSVENYASESFELHKGNSNGMGSHHSKALGSRSKQTPSKWDDAQKWLIGFSSGGNDGHSNSKPRNSNAEDRRLLHCASQRGRDSCSSADVGLEEDLALRNIIQEEGETKKIDCSDLVWRVNKPMEDSKLEVKAVSLRDFGTEMTPIASQDHSRTATPIRATTPVLTSPISSRSSTPGRCRQGGNSFECFHTGVKNLQRDNEAVLFGTASGNGWAVNREGTADGRKVVGDNDFEQMKNSNSLESRAMAWNEAERTKYMARFKREEVKIQAWENHEKRKAEMEMKKIEVKAERLKSRAQEKLANKLAATRRIAEEKRSNAESKLNESAARTADKADYIRRTGHLPSSFFFKLPSLCG